MLITGSIWAIYKESIMDTHAMQNGVPPGEFVFHIPEITSDSKWFLWNTNSRGWTPFCTGAHDRFSFFHNVFFCDYFTKTSEITLKSVKITVRGWKSLQSVVETPVHISIPAGSSNFESQEWPGLNEIIMTFSLWPVIFTVPFDFDCMNTHRHCSITVPQSLNMLMDSPPQRASDSENIMISSWF